MTKEYISIDQQINNLEKQIIQAKDRLQTMRLISCIPVYQKYHKITGIHSYSDTIRNKAKHKETCKANRKKRKKRNR